MRTEICPRVLEDIERSIYQLLQFHAPFERSTTIPIDPPTTTTTMRFPLLPILTLLLPLALGAEVTTDYTVTNECSRKTQRGDSISVHYRGTLASDGSEFDASYNRGTPLDFTVGKGQVIKGWDDGLLDMCIGDKRTLTIPPEFGYGERAMGPIPAGSTLVFETELVGIQGVKKDEL